MALTMNLSDEQLAKELADAAMKRIEEKVHDALTQRVQAIIDEAAIEVTKLIKPAIIAINRNYVTGDVHVQLVLNNEKHKPIR